MEARKGTEIISYPIQVAYALDSHFVDIDPKPCKSIEYEPDDDPLYRRKNRVDGTRYLFRIQNH